MEIGCEGVVEGYVVGIGSCGKWVVRGGLNRKGGKTACGIVGEHS